MSGCLGDDTIASFVEGRLESERDAVVRAHIASCDACRQLVADATPVGAAAEPSDAEAGASTRSPATLDFVRAGATIAGKYEIRHRLGEGGMGAVAAAWHVELNRVVALKVMHPELAREPDAVKRFLREGRAAAQLVSDHAVRIYDVGRLDNGLPFIVMEHLEGEDLAERALKERPSVATAIDWVAQASDAIGEAHGKKLVHRDIKPANLFLARLPSGAMRVKVLDFGLAKDIGGPSASTSVAGRSNLTGENVILGSPHFMAPEQVRNAAGVDSSADVWALGATLFMLLTGEPPFTSRTVHGVLARILADPAPRASALRPDVPAHVDAAIARCLAKDPAGRFASVASFVAALRGADARVATPSQPDLPSTVPNPDTEPDHVGSTIEMASAPTTASGAQVPSTKREARFDTTRELVPLPSTQVSPRTGETPVANTTLPNAGKTADTANAANVATTRPSFGSDPALAPRAPAYLVESGGSFGAVANPAPPPAPPRSRWPAIVLAFGFVSFVVAAIVTLAVPRHPKPLPNAGTTAPSTEPVTSAPSTSAPTVASPVSSPAPSIEPSAPEIASSHPAPSASIARSGRRPGPPSPAPTSTTGTPTTGAKPTTNPGTTPTPAPFATSSRE